MAWGWAWARIRFVPPPLPDLEDGLVLDVGERLDAKLGARGGRQLLALLDANLVRALGWGEGGIRRTLCTFACVFFCKCVCDCLPMCVWFLIIYRCFFLSDPF